MRQTFADEIINAGYGLHPETVVFKVNSSSNAGFRLDHDKSIPPFDNCFIEIEGKKHDQSTLGVCINRAETAWIAQIFGTHDYDQSTILVFPKLLNLEYTDGYLTDAWYSPVDIVPPLENFKPGLTEKIANDIFYLGMYGFSLLHQQHEIELVDYPRNVKRFTERKTGKKPSPYFEIKIDPSKPEKRYTSSKKTGRSKNAHIVRGHFATYTDDAPLFGKYTGTYWRPAHARGVTDGQQPDPKHYRIVLPNKEQS